MGILSGSLVYNPNIPRNQQNLSRSLSHSRTPGLHVFLAALQARNLKPQTARFIRVQAAAPEQSFSSIDETNYLPSDAEVVPLQGGSLKEVTKRFKGIRAFVAGASGGTGRAIVERLVAEGVPVRALVRDLDKAAAILPGPDKGVELVKGDVFQYATLPSAIGDSNVVLVATGSRPALDPLGPFNVDYEGTKNIVAAAKNQGVEKIVLVTSIGVDDTFFPLNLFWGVLFWKKRAEEAVQRSGIDHTIIRPGGLRNTPKDGELPGAIVVGRPDTFGLPPRRAPGSILRSQVADLCVEALVEPSASGKVVEAISEQNGVVEAFEDLFTSI